MELARELHDVVAHHVAGIVVQAQAARLIAANSPETVQGMLVAIESAGDDALVAMRRVVGLLRDPDDTQGLAPEPEQLDALLDRFAARHGLQVHRRLPELADGDWGAWPPEVATTIYRITQEALTNIALHARGATNVTVTVDGDPERV